MCIAPINTRNSKLNSYHSILRHEKKNNFQMPSAAKKDPIIIMNVEIKIENDQTKPSKLFRSEPNQKKKKVNLKPNLKFWKHKLRRLKWETSVIVVVGVTVLLGLLRASSLTERFERRGKVWRRGFRFSRPKLLWCYASNSNLNIHLKILGFNSAAALIWNLRATINIPLLSVIGVGQHHSQFPPNEI